MRGPRLVRWGAWLCLLAAADPVFAQPPEPPTRRLKVRSDRPDAQFYLIRSRVLDNLAPTPAQRPAKVLNAFQPHPMSDEPIMLVDATYYLFVLCGTQLKPPLGQWITGRDGPLTIPCR